MHRLLLCVFLIVSVTTIKTFADSYQYVNGKCINASGQEGLNPVFSGPCSDFRGIDLGKISLDGRDFRGSRFDNANLQKVSFKGCQLEGTNFTAAQLIQVDFDSANLDLAIFVRALISKSQWTNVSANYITVENTTLLDTPLSYSLFQNSIWKQTRFFNVDLSGVDLSYSQFKNSDLTKVTFESTNFLSSSIQNTRLRALDFKNTNFDKSDLSESDIHRSNLLKSSIKDTVFSKTKYTNKTILPFSSEEATARGMILYKIGSIFVIGDSADVAGLRILGANLVKLGHTYEVFSGTSSTFDNNTNLYKYDVVLYLNSDDYSKDMSEVGQKNLLDFVNAGGIFISYLYSNYMVSVGRLQTMQDLILANYSTGPSLCPVINNRYAVNLKPSESSGLFENSDQTVTIKNIDYCFGYSKRNFSISPVKVIATSMGTDEKNLDLIFQRQIGVGTSYFLGWNCNGAEAGCFADSNFASLISRITQL